MNFSNFCKKTKDIRAKGVKFNKTNKEMFLIHEAREMAANKQKEHTEFQKKLNTAFPIPLGGKSGHSYVADQIAKRNRKRSYVTRPSIKGSYLYSVDTYPYKGSHSSHKLTVNTVYIQSSARFVGRHILYTIETSDGIQHGKFVCPKGYSLEVKNSCSPNIVLKKNGAKDAELHLDSSLILSGPAACRHELLENLNKRKVIEKEQKEKIKADNKFIKSLETTYITVQDARQAGNCMEGIRAFAGKNKFLEKIQNDPYFSLPAKKLLEISKNDSWEFERVKKSATVAMRRETMVCI